MRKVIITIMVFTFIANVSAQLKVDSAGNTRVAGNIYLGSDSNLIATSNNVPNYV
jgi:hypothetical protein